MFRLASRTGPQRQLYLAILRGPLRANLVSTPVPLDACNPNHVRDGNRYPPGIQSRIETSKTDDIDPESGTSGRIRTSVVEEHLSLHLSPWSQPQRAAVSIIAGCVTMHTRDLVEESNCQREGASAPKTIERRCSCFSACSDAAERTRLWGKRPEHLICAPDERSSAACRATVGARRSHRPAGSICTIVSTWHAHWKWGIWCGSRISVAFGGFPGPKGRAVRADRRRPGSVPVA